MGLVGGEPKYIYNDVARALDYANPSDVLGRLDQDDLAWSEVIDSMGRPQRMTVIGEANMWALICRSEKPGARIFFGHLCSVILPALRKTGKLPPGERLLLPGTTSVQVEEEDAELAKIDLLRDMRVREIERDKSIKALQARQGELQDGQKRIEVLIDVIADDAAAAKAAAMAAAVDAAAAKEAVRRNPPQPGEVSMGTAAQAAGWESWTKKRGRLWHSRAVGDAARSAGFVGRGLMIERDHVADDGKPYPMWYFTQIGYVAFMSEIASNRKPPAPFIIPGSTKNCPNYVYWHGVPNPTKGGAKDLPFSEDQGGDE
jgi:prophage antirepressor-like protein